MLISEYFHDNVKDFRGENHEIFVSTCDFLR